jgi:hypothetical protein
LLVADPISNVTELDRRVVPLTPKPAPKPVPVTHPEPVTPGGGGKNPADPIAPGDKNPTTPGGDRSPEEPVRLGTGDKDPAAPTGDKDGNAQADKDADDMDLWCEAGNIAVKRALEARAPGDRCSGRPRERTTDERRAYYSERATKGEDTIRGRPRDSADYERRRNTYYRPTREESPEPFIGETLERTDYNRRYGFRHDYTDEVAGAGSWQTHSTFSNGNDLQPVTRVSYGRSETTPDHIAMIAHERFASRDSNRYQIDERGNTLTDRDGNYLPADGYQRNSVPASHLVHRSAVDGGYFNPPPRRISFMSENIVNRDAQAAIRDAFASELPRERNHMLLRRDSGDLERRHYDQVANIDNNYSYMNTAARNREYDGYSPRDIDVYQRDNGYDTSYNWERD